MTILARAWPIESPDRPSGGMAASIERATTQAGRYPAEWPQVAWLVKTMAGWRCERCQVPHGPIPHVLTVHHLDEVKANLEHWNLAALCQRCHLQVQNRVAFYQDWPFEHTAWMARHVADYNEWARRQRCAACHGTGGVDRWRDGHFLGSGWICDDCGGRGHRPLLSLRGVVDRDPATYWSEARA